MWTLTLPELGGTRDAATDLVDGRLRAENLQPGSKVVLLAHNVLSTSSSFADQLVKLFFEEHQASGLVLVAPPARLRRLVEESATRRGFEKDVATQTAAAAGV